MSGVDIVCLCVSVCLYICVCLSVSLCVSIINYDCVCPLSAAPTPRGPIVDYNKCVNLACLMLTFRVKEAQM